MLIRVVLPAPLGPSRPKNSPSSISRLTRSNAWKWPRAEGYILETDWNETAGMGAEDFSARAGGVLAQARKPLLAP